MDGASRVVQSALRTVIEPIFERIFAPQSYGFRPGRSCKDALRRVEELLQSGHACVVDIDIKKYFDTIPHDRLLELVAEHIADGQVLGLIEAFLRAGVMGEMEGWEPSEGTPQGAYSPVHRPPRFPSAASVISPLLANLYLNPLDGPMVQNGLEMVRYADDRGGGGASGGRWTGEPWSCSAATWTRPDKRWQPSGNG